jgi:hypothetical protein
MDEPTAAPAGAAPVRNRRRRTDPAVLVVACVLVAVAAVLVGAALLPSPLNLFTPDPPPVVGPAREVPPEERRGGSGGWMKAKLTLGREAPEFTLPTLAGAGEVRLAHLRSKRPAVLIFGSFSCDIFCRDSGAVQRFYQKHKDRVEILFVLVAEAGPHVNPGLEFVLEGDNSPEARRLKALRAMKVLKLDLPAVMDGVDRQIERAYEAWPNRLVVVGTDGRLAFDAGRDFPTGWNWDAIEDWLANYLS